MLEPAEEATRIQRCSKFLLLVLPPGAKCSFLHPRTPTFKGPSCKINISGWLQIIKTQNNNKSYFWVDFTLYITNTALDKAINNYYKKKNLKIDTKTG